MVVGSLVAPASAAPEHAGVVLYAADLVMHLVVHHRPVRAAGVDGLLADLGNELVLRRQ